MYIDNMAHWQAIVRCLQEWRASGIYFSAWPWERKMYPYARASADQIFLGLSRTEEQLVHEATLFSNFAVGRLRELYAEKVRLCLFPSEPSAIMASDAC